MKDYLKHLPPTISLFISLNALSFSFGLLKEERTLFWNFVDVAPIVWGYACLIMGAYMIYKIGKKRELLYGLLFLFLCYIPIVTPLIGWTYFMWCYIRIDRHNNLGNSPLAKL